MKPERREVETKFQLKAKTDVKLAEGRLKAFGFTAVPERTELDYTLDTPEWSCRHNGLILRFRRIQQDGRNPVIVLTLKQKRQHEAYQDYDETELTLGTGESEAWDYIQSVLGKVIGQKLPEEIKEQTEFRQIIKTARSSGFSRHRILLEKRRREFRHKQARVNATIDSFPDGIGTYLEIEAHDPEALERWVNTLKLNEFEPEPLDYGEILKRHNQAKKSEVKQRTAVFDQSIARLIGGL